jgi:hypothetical protein
LWIARLSGPTSTAAPSTVAHRQQAAVAQEIFLAEREEFVSVEKTGKMSTSRFAAAVRSGFFSHSLNRGNVSVFRIFGQGIL